jgi:hypothetical protein
LTCILLLLVVDAAQVSALVKAMERIPEWPPNQAGFDALEKSPPYLDRVLDDWEEVCIGTLDPLGDVEDDKEMTLTCDYPLESRNL